MGNEYSYSESSHLDTPIIANIDKTYSLEWFKLRENSTQLNLSLLKKAFKNGYRSLCPYTLFLTSIESGDYETALQVIYLSDMTQLTEDALHELLIALVVSVEACTPSLLQPGDITTIAANSHNNNHTPKCNEWTHKKVYAFLNLWEYLYHCHGAQDFMGDCDLRGMCKVLRKVEYALQIDIVRFLNV